MFPSGLRWDDRIRIHTHTHMCVCLYVLSCAIFLLVSRPILIQYGVRDLLIEPPHGHQVYQIMLCMFIVLLRRVPSDMSRTLAKAARFQARFQW